MSRVPQHIIDRVAAECAADGRPWPAPTPGLRTWPRSAIAAGSTSPGVDIDAIHRNPRLVQIPTRKARP